MKKTSQKKTHKVFAKIFSQNAKLLRKYFFAKCLFREISLRFCIFCFIHFNEKNAKFHGKGCKIRTKIFAFVSFAANPTINT